MLKRLLRNETRLRQNEEKKMNKEKENIKGELRDVRVNWDECVM